MRLTPPGLSTRRHARAGFTLIEIIIAAVLLGLTGLGIARVLSQNNTRATEALERQTALGLAKSTVERIRAAGPLTYRTSGESFQAASDGSRTASGPYRVTILRNVSCQGGQVTEDTPASLLSWNCGAQKPIVTYKVLVNYASSTAGASGGTATAGIVHSVAQSTTFADAELTGTACSGGMAWNPATGACACPGGQTLVSGGCQCGAGTAWTGTSCVASTCSTVASEYATRSDCTGGQVGTSTWRRDPVANWCRTSATPTYNAWSEVGRSCSCPANLPSWDGVRCACPAASSALTAAPSCPGGQVVATMSTRTFDAATCTLSSWTPGTCACPSGRVWTGTVCGCANAGQPTAQAASCPTNQVSTANMTRAFDAATCTYGAWTGGSCGCPSTLPTLGSDNTCYAACPATEIWDPATNSCRLRQSATPLSIEVVITQPGNGWLDYDPNAPYVYAGGQVCFSLRSSEPLASSTITANGVSSTTGTLCTTYTNVGRYPTSAEYTAMVNAGTLRPTDWIATTVQATAAHADGRTAVAPKAIQVYPEFPLVVTQGSNGWDSYTFTQNYGLSGGPNFRNGPAELVMNWNDGTVTTYDVSNGPINSGAPLGYEITADGMNVRYVYSFYGRVMRRDWTYEYSPAVNYSGFGDVGGPFGSYTGTCMSTVLGVTLC